MAIRTQGYASQSATSPLAPYSFERRDPGPRDVLIEIQYCGVCHSDLHHVRNEWHGTSYPAVPGHEILGRVSRTGAEVHKFREGDVAAVGCLVDSCRTCRSCREGLEQFCEAGPVFTYGSSDKHTGGTTYGGYSSVIVVDQDFVLKVPPNINLAGAAPLLCAGITTYSPLRRHRVGAGMKVGVIGLGGLGHMAVKLARVMGAQVVVLTSHPKKIEPAIRLGAHEALVWPDAQDAKKHRNTFDYILDTVSVTHDLGDSLELLKRDGTLTLVGAPEKPLVLSSFGLIMRRRRLTGSLIGGLPETQEMLDFCAEHRIVSDIELIPIQKINEAYERMLKGDVRYRFVIDMNSLSEPRSS